MKLLHLSFAILLSVGAASGFVTAALASLSPRIPPKSVLLFAGAAAALAVVARYEYRRYRPVKKLYLR